MSIYFIFTIICKFMINLDYFKSLLISLTWNPNQQRRSYHQVSFISALYTHNKTILVKNKKNGSSYCHLIRVNHWKTPDAVKIECVWEGVRYWGWHGTTDHDMNLLSSGVAMDRKVVVCLFINKSRSWLSNWN